MTWDWIADTLYMIECDLRDRVKMCPSVAKRDVEYALSGVQRAKNGIVEAVAKMQREGERKQARLDLERAAANGEPYPIADTLYRMEGELRDRIKVRDSAAKEHLERTLGDVISARKNIVNAVAAMQRENEPF